MTEKHSQPNLRQVKKWQREAARAEYLHHPDASIAEVAKATGVAVRTVARARETLVKEGLLAPGRNATTSAADAAALALTARTMGTAPPKALQELQEGPQDDPGSTIRPKQGPTAPRQGTIDGEALRKMSEMLDQLADEDDDITRKRMLRQVKRFAFDPNLHPDTRMSASQLWAKLLDMQRAKDLGPGVPLTIVNAVERVTDFDKACGVKIAVSALFRAFPVEQVLAEVNLIFKSEAPDGHSSPEAVEQGQPSSALVAPAGPPDNDAPVRPQA